MGDSVGCVNKDREFKAGQGGLGPEPARWPGREAAARVAEGRP